MAGIPNKIHNTLIRESIDLARYEAGLRARVLRLLETLGRDLVKELAAAGLDTPRTDWQRARLRELLKAAEQRASEVYGEVDALTRKELGGLVEVSADRVVMGVNKAIGADLLQKLNWTEEQLAALADENLIFGASSGTWWKRQAVDYAQGFADQMRMGQLRGEALGDLVKRVRGLQDISRRNAEALVRSSVISTANEAHLAAYRANSEVAAGVEWVATLDRKTCLVAGTPLMTPSGPVPIERMAVGDAVIGGSGTPRTVTATMNKTVKKTLKVTLSNGESIRCTADHEWLLGGQKWVEAKSLNVGDVLAFALK